jgi:AcrR family transcriptional regulator
MSTQTSTPPPKSARERLLASAQELFYQEGINTVGIDRIIEHAGVAKASLYGVFGSKEELVRAYLIARQEARQALFAKALLRFDTPREKLLGVFDVLGELFADPKFRGCALLRAKAELKPACSAKGVWESSRAWAHSFFTQLARDAGAADPEQLGKQLVILYDGASVTATMDGNPRAAAVAKGIAAAMLDANTTSP